MKSQLISAGLGFTCLVLGAASTLFAHGGTMDDMSLFGRTLALGGAIILGAALISHTIRSNSDKTLTLRSLARAKPNKSLDRSHGQRLSHHRWSGEAAR